MTIGPGIPGATMEAFSQGFDCGLVGTLGVTIDDGNNVVILPRTTANIVEIECVNNIAVYRYLGVYPSDPSLSPYVITWDDTISLATEEILVSADAPAPASDSGPCSSWVEAEDVVACCGDLVLDSDNAAAIEAFAGVASDVLFGVSGEMFTGLCGPITVRPCAQDCGCWPFQNIAYTNGGSRWLYTGYNDWIWTGNSWWCGSTGRGCCGCLSQVLLSGYPVQGIAQVKIDGTVLAPSQYRLDENRWLTRTDDAFWPACQDLSKEDDQAGTWSVSYWYGATPPQLAKDAAAALACELFNACDENRECALPDRVTRIVRQGITIERISALAQMLVEGATGVPVIDAFVARYGGYGRRRPSVWSPDGPRYARQVGS